MDDRKELIKKFAGAKAGAEVGVSHGRYSEKILRGVPTLEKMYCVDRWQGRYIRDERNAVRRLSKYPNAIILKGDSVEMSEQIEDESLDFVYIDGDHTAYGVERDLMAWIPKVKKGGIVSGHDWQLPDVRNTVERLVKDKIIILNPNQKYPSWYYVK